MENFDGMAEMFDDLVLKGALQIVGVDSETGDFLYNFTEKLAEVNPVIYELMIEDFHSSIMRLWEAGFLAMDVTSENPVVNATEKVFDSDAISNLSDQDQTTLRDILKKMSE